MQDFLVCASNTITCSYHGFNYLDFVESTGNAEDHVESLGRK